MQKPANRDSARVRWTRHRVAQHLGVSIATVRRMEGRSLHPIVDEQGVRWFDSNEVEAVIAERALKPITKRDDEGEVAARVFDLFRVGADLRKVVVSTRVHPRVVRELYAEWLVSLHDGEQKRRTAQVEAEQKRVLATVEREHKAWLRELGSNR